MNKNEEFVVRIEDFSTQGEGIGHVDGFALFVKNAAVGDLARVKIMKLKKNYGYAKLMEILEPSPWRVEPKCKLAGKCGGCQLQHYAYEKQLEFKENKIKNCLKRIGKIENVPMEPIIGMDSPFYYRNKAQFPVGRDKEGKLVIGFYAGRTHSIMDTSHCCIQAPVNEQIIGVIREFMEKYGIEPYDETEHKGLVRHILTRTGFETGETMVCLAVNGRRLPHADKLVEKLIKIDGLVGIVLNVNRERTNVILGKEIINIWGRNYIIDSIGKIRYQISPLSFYQVNPRQTRKLYETALSFADLHGEEVVWDLYCGIGTISLFLAQKAKQVYGVEIVPEAIEDARKNAAINHISNVEFFVGAAEETLPEKYEESGGKMRADVVVIDPPRKGCEESLLRTVVDMRPEKIVYVSCDPATLARDVKYLGENGFELKRVRGCDMFGGSIHVETIVLLSHKSPDSTINVKVEFGEGEGKVPLDAIAERAKKYQLKPKITYKMIQEYVEKKYGFQVHTAYIAEVKRALGLTMYDAPNAGEEVKQSRKHPPKEKVEAIKDALKYFEVS